MLQHHYSYNSTYLLAARLQNNKETQTVNDSVWTCDQKLTPVQVTVFALLTNLDALSSCSIRNANKIAMPEKIAKRIANTTMAIFSSMPSAAVYVNGYRSIAENSKTTRTC